MSLKFTFRSRLRELAEQLPKAAAERTALVAREIADHARQNAPVKTGALRDSITVEDDPATGVSRVKVGVPYASVVEYGSSRQAAEPYLTPAVESVKPTLPAHYKKLIE